MKRIVTSLALGLSLSIYSAGVMQARLFAPQVPTPKLEADETTVALYEFREPDFKKGEMPDVTQKSAAGKILGDWAFVAEQAVMPGYRGIGKILSSNAKARSQVVFGGLKDLAEGAYSVDVLLRWNRGGGYFFRGGEGLALGVLHRGPGLFTLRVPVKGADGKVKIQAFEANTIYETAPTVRFDNFYTYSLTYDGAKTFEVLIDGQKVFTATVAEGEVAGRTPECAVGDVEKWNSAFVGGEIAAVRISRGVRSYQAAKTNDTVFQKDRTGAWVFDAGKVDSPLEPGAIRLTSQDAYDSAKGYGWLEPVSGDFDAPAMADRFAATPEIGLEKGSYRLVDALQRDGVVAQSGPLFRVDVPDGLYWVSLEMGHNRGAATVDVITANGVTLGEKFAMSSNTFNGHLNGRTARGLVKAEGGRGIRIETKASGAKGQVPVKSIEILPYKPLPVALEKGRLIWRGEGLKPAELNQVSTDLASNNSVGAIDAARKIADPFIQANVLSLILGIPKQPASEDIALAGEVRQLLLQALREHPDNVAAQWLFDSTERFRHTLIAYVEEGGNDVVAGSRFALWQGTANQGLQLRPEDPEYWQAHFLAGAGIWQNGVQNSAFDNKGTTDSWLPDKSVRLQGFDAPGKIFREVIKAYPDFRIARIMLGERLPAEKNAWVPPENAPAWAVMQYQLMHRIQEVIHYWVNERMDERGLLGGGLGDDVEALRWWNPGVVLADDETTISGWRRMAEAAWASTDGLGYSRGMDDVEHSAEPTADPLPMLALMNFNTPAMSQTEDRLMKTLPIFRDTWTTITPDGYRMFKGYHFNATSITREGDVPYNIRAIKPLLWAAWVDEGKNKELQDLLIAYAKSWRDAVLAEFDGKPAGIVPTMIKLSRQQAREPSAPDWAASGYQTYKYPGGYVAKVYDLLMAAYEMSGDKSFLQPIQLGLDELQKIPDEDKNPDKYPFASREWAFRAGAGFLGVAGGDYRSITGDKSYDETLLRWGPPSVKFRILAERAKDAEQFQSAVAGWDAPLKEALEIMSSNPEMRTVMIQSTDRIYVAGSLTLTSMATGMAVPASDLRGGEIVWPAFAVTWRGTGAEVAILVSQASPSELEVQIYNFSDKAKTLHPWVWRLDAGTFEMMLGETDASGFTVRKELSRQEVAITGRGQELSVEVPPRTPLRFSLIKK